MLKNNILKVPYGEQEQETPWSESDFSQILRPQSGLPILNHRAAFERHLSDLREKLKKSFPCSVTVLVEDKTRQNTEYPEWLARIAEIIRQVTSAEINLLIAYGTHPHHMQSENERLYGIEAELGMKIVDHDSRNKDEMRPVGLLPSGRTLFINRIAVEADFRISFGSVEPHVFAGFTGGRKIILPGISAYENIRYNHAQVIKPGVQLGQLDHNPIHIEMAAAARLIPIHFSFQLVRDSQGRLIGLFAGEPESAFEQAVDLCRKAYTVRIQNPADITVVSPGGIPKDRSLYQSQRAVHVATQVTKPGGTIIFFGRLNEGIGDTDFERCLQWTRSRLLALKCEEIEVGVHSAYLLAKSLTQCQILFISDLDPSLMKKTGLISIRDMAVNLSSLWELLLKKYGSACIRYFIPNGSRILCIPSSHKKREVDSIITR